MLIVKDYKIINQNQILQLIRVKGKKENLAQDSKSKIKRG